MASHADNYFAFRYLSEILLHMLLLFAIEQQFLCFSSNSKPFYALKLQNSNASSGNCILHPLNFIPHKEHTAI